MANAPLPLQEQLQYDAAPGVFYRCAALALQCHAAAPWRPQNRWLKMRSKKTGFASLAVENGE
jgi:hypothetical protein